MGTSSIKVVIVDDHPIVREGVRMIMENDDGIRLVGEAGSVAEALQVIGSELPDVTLLDLNLGTDSSLDRLAEMVLAAGKGKILILTGVVDSRTNHVAAENGAYGVVLKNQAAKDLLGAIRKVHSGEKWFDRTLTSKLLDDLQKKNKDASEVQQLLNTLTSRELEIVELIAEGLVNKDVGQRLAISEKTVRNHLTTVYSKLRINGRLELAIFASQNGLIPRT
jgi:DNA-binding NarL/FixJ family response regulator